ncbi:MAG: DUF4154 domain-containing protein [Alphaproteobacteria bacterium]|nr:DUF4154 domain-containing protein [Alphaproteobacteria bacterium]
MQNMIVSLSKIAGRMKKLFKAAVPAFLAAGLLFAPPPARAQEQEAASASYVTQKDIQVAVRAFSFVYGMPAGAIQIEIVYDPNDAASMAEAQDLEEIIRRDGTFANRRVTAKPVTVAAVGTTGSRFAYVTHGLAREYPALVANARSHKMLTFSTDFRCVDSQSCVMGVVSEPSINIEISRAAATASGVQFSQALELMVREVE